MSLMLKLLATAALLSSAVYAETVSDTIEDFLDDQFMGNSRIKNVDVHVESVVPLKEVKGWNGYIVDVKAVLKKKPKDVINQKMIWFSNGTVITKDLVSLENGKNLREEIKPKFKDAYYRDANLIYGNKDAKHKIKSQINLPSIIITFHYCVYIQPLPLW